MNKNKILILGANGMIGHKIYQILSFTYKDIWAHFRCQTENYNFFNSNYIINDLDLTNLLALKKCLNEIKPNIIINTAGITIRRGIHSSKKNTILINSILPYFLDEWVSSNNSKLIHFSTDCVFSGIDGSYDEKAILDANDLYGITKGLGEVVSKNTLTLRSSMIGRELQYKTELLEWFLSKKNEEVNGYSNVIYSGITTLQMAYFVNDIIHKFPELTGLFNIASNPISKNDLLLLLNKHFNNNSIILKDESYISKKNLIAQKFYSTTQFDLPDWEEMIIELKKDSDKYYKYYNK